MRRCGRMSTRLFRLQDATHHRGVSDRAWCRVRRADDPGLFRRESRDSALPRVPPSRWGSNTVRSNRGERHRGISLLSDRGLSLVSEVSPEIRAPSLCFFDAGICTKQRARPLSPFYQIFRASALARPHHTTLQQPVSRYKPRPDRAALPDAQEPLCGHADERSARGGGGQARVRRQARREEVEGVQFALRVGARGGGGLGGDRLQGAVQRAPEPATQMQQGRNFPK